MIKGVEKAAKASPDRKPIIEEKRENQKGGEGFTDRRFRKKLNGGRTQKDGEGFINRGTCIRKKSNPRKMAKASSIEEQTKNLETSTEEVAMLYQFQGLFLFYVKKRLFRVKILT